MKHLSASELAVLRDALRAREDVLSATLERALAESRQDASSGREVDAAIIDLNSALNFAEALREQDELAAVRGALVRIDRGTYGRCWSCGVRIPIERLRVQPAAELCQVCQTRAESGQLPTEFAP